VWLAGGVLVMTVSILLAAVDAVGSLRVLFCDRSSQIAGSQTPAAEVAQAGFAGC
jgi:hypothetical protein